MNPNDSVPTEGSKTKGNSDASESQPERAVATFGAGCFWCVEAVFQALDGVESVESGYEGGLVANPSYEQVCSGQTGHAEVCKVTYDSKKLSFEELLEVFWKTHDPTTLNRQGADVGTQYRSVIFFQTEDQQKTAEDYKKRLDASGAFNAPIVTEISRSTQFYPAEKYHQDYYKLNGGNRYCQLVIRPKMKKFRAVFAERLKKE